MKKLIKKIEDTFAAVAFAEAGEFVTAKEIAGETSLSEKIIKELKHEVSLTIDDLISIAIAFAEAGEHKKAVEILKEAEDKLEEIKLSHQKDLKGTILTPKTSSI